MDNLRKYGDSPFKIAVLHGGPGISGEMSPVAEELCSLHGVLEPLQKAVSLQGQVQELYDILEENSSRPITIIGWSWGAILGFIYTAKYSAAVKKLILVSSGVFQKKYASKIEKTRMKRLDPEERVKLKKTMKALYDPSFGNKDMIMLQLEKLLYKTDFYNPTPFKSDVVEYRYDVFRSVWKDMEKFRASGRLLKMGRNISCPVVAIHGDYDPHPYQGIKEPLRKVVSDFKFILLDNCGHKPWIEKDITGSFYSVVREELQDI
ncbi:MAG: alpha/beta hydrolase [Actinomycetota bacterium]|nr:alpha/beta hydrolase [Actinomycetota bacterium]